MMPTYSSWRSNPNVYKPDLQDLVSDCMVQWLWNCTLWGPSGLQVWFFQSILTISIKYTGSIYVLNFMTAQMCKYLLEQRTLGNLYPFFPLEWYADWKTYRSIQACMTISHFAPFLEDHISACHSTEVRKHEACTFSASAEIGRTVYFFSDAWKHATSPFWIESQLVSLHFSVLKN